MLRRAIPRLCSAAVSLPGNKSLQDHDPELHAVLQKELRRQVEGLELIASENFTSRAVMECLGSVATNKYAEGLPGARYYGGTQFVDQIENLCRDRALSAFSLDPAKWGVNVQPYSGSPANFAAYSAILQPHDRLMGLDLPAGGHLTHGFYTATRRVSGSSIYFESLPYGLDKNGFVDYDNLEQLAKIFKPKLIIAGGSAYPRDWDYERYRAICDQVGAYFLVDMSHFSGLVAAGEHNNPFEFAHIVTTTTHKSLRGPRSGMIFFLKANIRGSMSETLEERVNNAVFPMLQGGPHEHQIAAVATQLKEVKSPEFKAYIQQVKRNAKALAEGLVARGNVLASGGTDNHLMLWNLRPHSVTGSKFEKLLDLVHITANKNSVLGDKSAITPGGVRLGTPALTTRGFVEKNFVDVADFLQRAVEIAKAVESKQPGQKLVEFVRTCESSADVAALGKEVKEYAGKFPFPGFENPFPLKK
jgi:glycine hydroxymethyltransferase